MNALSSSIVQMFEVCGLNIEQIATEQQLEVSVVKSVLLNYSSKYRELDVASREDVQGDPLCVTKEEHLEFLEAYKHLARYADHEGIREKALRNLINHARGVHDGLGENDPRKLLKEMGNSGNILNLNMIIAGAKSAKAKVSSEVEEILDLKEKAGA